MHRQIEPGCRVVVYPGTKRFLHPSLPPMPSYLKAQTLTVKHVEDGLAWVGAKPGGRFWVRLDDVGVVSRKRRGNPV
jgi:hypothetical protein